MKALALLLTSVSVFAAEPATKLIRQGNVTVEYVYRQQPWATFIEARIKTESPTTEVFRVSTVDPKTGEKKFALIPRGRRTPECSTCEWNSFFFMLGDPAPQALIVEELMLTSESSFPLAR
jgi:hypothetical protein